MSKPWAWCGLGQLFTNEAIAKATRRESGAHGAKITPLYDRDDVLEEVAAMLEGQHTWITAAAAANLVRAMRSDK